MMSVDRCPWYIAGPLFGLLMVGLRATLNKPFGALGGYIDVTARRSTISRAPGFRVALLIGLVLGGTLYAATLGTFAPSLGYLGCGLPAGEQSGIIALLSLAAAGVLMGFGARTAGGCTSGHGMSGMSLGSPASIVAGMTFFGTAVFLARALLYFGGAS